MCSSDLLAHEDVHEALPPVIGSSSWLTGDTTPARHTSAFLESLGFPGIIYPDSNSRKPGRDVFNNIVTFENTPVSIERKYEQGGPVGALRMQVGGGDKIKRAAKLIEQLGNHGYSVPHRNFSDWMEEQPIMRRAREGKDASVPHYQLPTERDRKSTRLNSSHT